MAVLDAYPDFNPPLFQPTRPAEDSSSFLEAGSGELSSFHFSTM
jgi:hypothetical protein